MPQDDFRASRRCCERADAVRNRYGDQRFATAQIFRFCFFEESQKKWEWSGLRGSNPSSWLGKPEHYHYAKPASLMPEISDCRFQIYGNSNRLPFVSSIWRPNLQS